MKATATVHSIYRVWLIGRVLIDKVDDHFIWCFWLSSFLFKMFSYSIDFGFCNSFSGRYGHYEFELKNNFTNKPSFGFGSLSIQTKDTFLASTKPFNRNTKQLNKTKWDISLLCILEYWMWIWSRSIRLNYFE